ncbi:MAG TPA: benzoate-CoA ligase family protein [Vicinamibacterales bacterium]|jgi:benzoate-CoA ligase
MGDPIEPPPERLNFAAHLFALNAMRGRKIAYQDDARTLTYSELARAARCFGSALLASGMRPEERIVLVMHDTVDWPIAFLGCLHAGLVPIPANTLLAIEELGWIVADSHARAAIVSPPLKAAFDAALERIGVRIPVITDVAALVERGDADAAAADTPADASAFWLYSSGSTGRCKGTVHTHGNLFVTASTYGRHVLQLSEEDVTFSAAKLFFAYGLGNSLTFPLSAGATVVLMPERPTPEAVFKRMIERQPTVFFGVPTLYAGMLASPALPAPHAVRLRRCASAGEALPREIGERFTAHFGAPILDGIGSTEMLHIFLSNRADDLRYGTSGKAVPGYELKLLNDAGEPVADGEIGDLYVKGDSHALFYWCNRAKTRATFLGHWTRTGDKYVRDAEGYWTYAGRSDDMIKVSGQYVSPFEVESCLVQHAAVLEAAVVGVPNEDGLLRTKAFVVLKSSEDATSDLESELKNHVKSRLAPHKYPRAIEFVTELPKTPTGKIQRYRLRER